VLVPGGEVRLGFHGDDFKPTRVQVKSFARSAAAYDINPSIWRFVDSLRIPTEDGHDSDGRRTAFR
jgi:hypothetical protein